jgi:hypothetical protein
MFVAFLPFLEFSYYAIGYFTHMDSIVCGRLPTIELRISLDLPELTRNEWHVDCLQIDAGSLLN